MYIMMKDFNCKFYSFPVLIVLFFLIRETKLAL